QLAPGGNATAGRLTVELGGLPAGSMGGVGGVGAWDEWVPGPALGTPTPAVLGDDSYTSAPGAIVGRSTGDSRIAPYPVPGLQGVIDNGRPEDGYGRKIGG